MNVDIVNKWADALESGNYKQAEGYLRTEAGCFCGLGVLSDLIDPTAWDTVQWGYSSVAYKNDIEWEPSNGFDDYKKAPYLLSRISHEAGITFEQVQKIVAMNDDEGKSFPEIAAYIRQNFVEV
jgi:hypothetical protein